MKHVYDKDFRYTPADKTDITKTFARIKKQIEANRREAQEKVEPLRRKHGVG